MKTYTNLELRDFLKSLEIYRVSKVLSTKETVSYIDFDEYMVDQKAYVRQGGTYGPSIGDLNRYQELCDKWDQACKYQNTVLYAKQRDVAEYAKLSQ